MQIDLVSVSVSGARAAAAALDEHLRVLLGAAGLFRALGHETAGREMERAVARALNVVHVLRDELVCLEVIENFITRATHSQRTAPSSKE
ncbi:MAG: hypothetical protein ACTHU0_38585 [Kofleriaceae bacterium]